MPTYFRRDDRVVNGLGYAIPNNAVTYYAEPVLTLATVYADENGITPIPNPQFTDGLGQTAAYMLPGLYTIIYSGPQIQAITFPNQLVGGGGGGGGSTVAVWEGTPAGAVDGVNRTFTLTNGGTPLNTPPTQATVWVNFPLVPEDGYTLSGITVTYLVAPQVGDTVFAQGVIIV
jgi:hypothetical protein